MIHLKHFWYKKLSINDKFIGGAMGKIRAFCKLYRDFYLCSDQFRINLHRPQLNNIWSNYWIGKKVTSLISYFFIFAMFLIIQLNSLFYSYTADISSLNLSYVTLLSVVYIHLYRLLRMDDPKYIFRNI